MLKDVKISSLHENEKAILVGLIYKEQTEPILDEYLKELTFLADTAGASTVKTFKQRLPYPDKATFIGKGKVQEIKEYIETHEIDLVIFDDDISPSQQNNLERELKRKVIDRSLLIIDIFAKRARSAQAKAQVELAQLQYLLPRLRGLWTHLERQQGGIGMRGPGEKEIETDRRIVNEKISRLKERLADIDRQNFTQRRQREQLVRIALVGYTNVGKSTLLNTLAKTEVFAEDKLFATLDTTVRKLTIEQQPFLLSDTVGFIRKLPHNLIESFKSTLDEVRESDILLHVVDISHPHYEDQIAVVKKTLEELKVAHKPTLLICNKFDAFESTYFDPYIKDEDRLMVLEEFKQKLRSRYEEDVIFISALKKENLDELRHKIVEMIVKIRAKTAY